MKFTADKAIYLYIYIVPQPGVLSKKKTLLNKIRRGDQNNIIADRENNINMILK